MKCFIALLNANASGRSAYTGQSIPDYMLGLAKPTHVKQQNVLLKLSKKIKLSV